jgi:hypothetical protein
LTRTTDHSTVGGVADTVSVTEPFYRYAFDAAAASARTDTPDLMRVFRDEASLAEAYVALRDQEAEAHRDLAEASLRSFPAE